MGPTNNSVYTKTTFHLLLRLTGGVVPDYEDRVSALYYHGRLVGFLIL